MSRLADLYGKRRLLVAGLGLLAVGNLLGALAGDLGVLLVARSLQGAAVAVIAIGTSVRRDLLPPRRLIGGVALISSSLGFGSAVGLPLSGVVAQFIDWRWLFAGPAVLGLALTVATLGVVPETPVRASGGFDVRGALLLSLALVALLLGDLEGRRVGGSPRVLVPLGAAVVLLPVWVWSSLRTRWPLIDVRTAARRPILLTNLASLIVGFVMYVGYLATPQILQGDPT